MEAYKNNFTEYLMLKTRARRIGVPVATLLRFKERMFRLHLISLHGNGSPLSELVDYVAAFYSVEVTPQQLRKILQRSDREHWDAAVDSYRQHRSRKQQERTTSTQGV
jgi:hypothetical protein